MILPIILVIAVFIPGCFFYRLFKNKDKLHSLKMMRMFSFLYTEYKTGRYYWEFIKMYQKLLLIIISKYYYDHIQIKGCFILITILCY